LELRVLDPERGGDAAASGAFADVGGAAGVAPDEPALRDWDWAAGGCFLELAGGSDCVVLAKRVAGARTASFLAAAWGRASA
jgi:fructose-1,6-bisphosphatase/inositol monophosphatase family enzyme